MKKAILVAMLSIWFAFSAFPQTHPLLEDQELSSNIRLLESWIEAQMAYRRLPGISIGIIHDQELIYARGFGYSDINEQIPATPETIYRIASITKTFTATALMQLRDKGKLRLDDPIQKYLSWFKIENRFRDAPKITIRHLLTHTSGLPREAAFPYWTDHNFPTQDEMIEALADQETIYPPETRYKYSNLALALAGEIVSVVSKKTYEEYVNENILTPLGMTSTMVQIADANMPGLVTPYSRLLPDGTRRVMPFTDSKALTPAANMSSSVQDLAKYIALQFRDRKAGGHQILQGSTLREMHRVHWLRPNWQSGRGLGFSVWRQDGKTIVGHGGWVAGNRTQIAFIPEDKIGVIVLTNADDGEPGFFVRRIVGLLVPIIKKVASPVPPEVEADPAWNKYVGLYTDPSWFDTEILILNNRLVMNGYNYPPEEEPIGGIVELTPEGEHTFRMTGENGNGERVVFEFDDEGTIMRVKVGENYIYPKK